MEGKIVENKKEGSSLLSRSIPLFYLSHLSYLSSYLVCLRSTTPLWFTDTFISILIHHYHIYPSVSCLPLPTHR